MQRVTNNPLEDYEDKQLKRKFSNLYSEIHVHGLKDGALALSMLHLMENELIERDYDPSEVIGPKVI